MLSCKGWEAFPWLLSPPPGPHAAFLAFWGPPGAGFPPTLGFWRFQSLCVRWRFPLFSLIFKVFTTLSPVSMPITPQSPTATPQPTQPLAARDRTPRQTPPTLCSLPSAITPAGLWQRPWCSPPSTPPPCSGPAENAWCPQHTVRPRWAHSGDLETNQCVCVGGASGGR